MNIEKKAALPEHAAVDEIAVLARFKQIAGACNRMGCTQKFKTHNNAPFAKVCIPYA